MFELSVTLTRVLEFLTKELPEVFLEAQSLDLRRLTETLVFVLGHAAQQDQRRDPCDTSASTRCRSWDT